MGYNVDDNLAGSAATMTSQERADIITRMEVTDELERRAAENGLKYFVPTGKQADFIRSIGGGDIFVGIFSGGNGAGKTAGQINILGNIIFGAQSSWFDFPLFRQFAWPKRARIGSTSKNLEEIGAIETEIKSWWPQGRYEAEKKGKQYKSLYTTDTGWVIDVMSYGQDKTEWESATLGLCLFDEPPPREIFTATVARMRLGGMILIHMTALSDAGWIFDELIANDKKLIDNNKKVTVVYSDVEDACLEHGVRGFLEHNRIETMLSFYDAEEREARKSGRPTHLAGRIYNNFDESIHVIDDREIPVEWRRIQIIDPHDAIPFAMGWAAIDNIGDIYIYDEYPDSPFEDIKNTDLTFKDYATIIRSKEGRQRISHRLVDPNFGNKRYGNSGETLIEEMDKFGLELDGKINDSLEIGHHLVREWLQYDTKRPRNIINKPKLFILRRCRNHWVSMLRYGRKSGKVDILRDNLRLTETYKHYCDIIRYLIMWLTYNRGSLEGVQGNAKTVDIKTRKILKASTKYGGW